MNHLDRGRLTHGSRSLIPATNTVVFVHITGKKPRAQLPRLEVESLKRV
jgi:hypothetical protein